MEIDDVDILSIENIHEILGGTKSESNNLLVCKDLAVHGKFVNIPIKTEVAAIALCTRGTLPITVNLQRHVLREGSVMMYGLQSIITFGEASGDARINIILFSSKLIKDSIVDIKSIVPIIKYMSENLGELLQLDKFERNIINKYYDLLHDLMELNKIPLMRELLESFLHTLAEMYSKRLSDTVPVRTRQEEYFEKFLKEIAIRHKEERSVKYYADALHITPKYLSTIIKEISGRPATAWINDFVIHQAKILLRHSNKSVQEITYELNFSTQSFFGKFFKRHTGTSPSEYRHNDSF